ncbi:hypothetical protein [Kineococcus sp. SYSU DK001]|uniref:hypothetical protein n=1 Tax=Kineococcus sp. SYSU DK001 TaxID=3383122 RepID=UPI003D7CA06F
MTSTFPGSTAHPRETPFVPAPALVAVGSVVGLLVVAAYAGGVLLPHVVHDLHHLSHAELTGGAHDPKGLWPADAGLLGALVRLAGVCAAFAGWLLTAPAAVVSAFALRSAAERRAPRRVVLHLVVLALLVSATVVRFTPFGGALVTWSLD